MEFCECASCARGAHRACEVKAANRQRSRNLHAKAIAEQNARKEAATAERERNEVAAERAAEKLSRAQRKLAADARAIRRAEFQEVFDLAHAATEAFLALPAEQSLKLAVDHARKERRELVSEWLVSLFLRRHHRRR